MSLCTLLLLWAVPSAEPVPGQALPVSFHFAEEERADDVLAITAEEARGFVPQEWQPRMVIDGKLTDVPWPGRPPTAWRITESLYLLHDANATGHIYVWNATTKKLTDHGRGQPQTISGVGTLMLRKTPEVLSAGNASRTWEMVDFNPMTGQPRVAWQQVADKDSWMAFVGQRDGAPVLRYDDGFITFRAGQAPIVKQVDLGHWRPVTSDAVRGSKLLLLGSNQPEVFGYAHNGKLPKFTTEVGPLDLDDGTIRKIGVVAGSWTGHTAVPHPYTNVAWISGEEADRLADVDGGFRGPLLTLGFGPTGYVHENTLRLWPPKKMDE